MCVSAIYVLFVFFMLKGRTFAAKEGRLWGYCNDEVFDPQCPPEGAIIMGNALYGHIKIGRCLDRDLGGNLGCYTDQLAVMDRKCSGKNKCEVSFRDADMEGEFPCELSKALARYLEASYVCQNVHIPNTDKCHSPQKITVTSRDQYISSEISKKLGCGMESAPWVLEAKEQQKINVTFIDFDWKVKSREESPVRCPVKYGYMIDIITNDVIHICGGLVRERPLFLSEGHTVQIVFDGSIESDDNPNFLIKFKAIGCPKFIPPPNTWMKESNNDITIGCTGSDEKWRMRCIGNYWLGPQKDCSRYAKEEMIISSKVSSEDSNQILGMPPVIAFSAFGGIFLVFVSVIVTSVIGIICLKSKKKRSTDNDYYMSATAKPVILDGTMTPDSFPTYRSVQVKLPKKKSSNNHMLQQPTLNLLDSQCALPSLSSVPRHPPSVRESPHYYLLEGRDTTETEPLYDVVYQGLPMQETA